MQAHTNMNALSVRPWTTPRYRVIHSMNIDAEPWYTLQCIGQQIRLRLRAHTKQWKCTICSHTVNTTPFHNPTNIHAEPPSSLQCIWTTHQDEMMTSYYIEHKTQLQIQTHHYKRTNCSPNATPFHVFNEHINPQPSSWVIAIVVYSDSVPGWDYYDRILHRTRITVSNSSAPQYKHTSCSSRRNTAPVHEYKRTTVIAIAVYLASTSGWDYDLIFYCIKYCIDHK